MIQSNADNYKQKDGKVIVSDHLADIFSLYDLEGTFDSVRTKLKKQQKYWEQLLTVPVQVKVQFRIRDYESDNDSFYGTPLTREILTTYDRIYLDIGYDGDIKSLWVVGERTVQGEELATYELEHQKQRAYSEKQEREKYNELKRKFEQGV